MNKVNVPQQSAFVTNSSANTSSNPLKLKNKENSCNNPHNGPSYHPSFNSKMDVMHSGRSRVSAQNVNAPLSVANQAQSRERVPNTHSSMNNVKKFRREFGREITNASSNVSQNAGSRKPNRTKVVLAKGDSSSSRIKNSDITLDDSRRVDISTDDQRKVSSVNKSQIATNRQVGPSVRQTPSTKSVVQSVKVVCQDSPKTIKHKLSEDEKNKRKKEGQAGLEVCDILDLRNPQCVSEYAPDILKALMIQEQKYRIKKDFLERHPQIQVKTRGCVVEWISEVSDKFKLLPETVFITSMIVDYYMQNIKTEVQKSELQKIAISAMLIATKYEEIYPPSIKEMIKISGDKTIMKPDILKMECNMLAMLEFDFTFPTPYRFLERFCKLANADDYIQMQAQYLLELCIADGELISTFLPSELAAATMCMAFKSVRKVSAGWGSSANSLEKVSGYSEEHLINVVEKIVQGLAKLKKFDLVGGVKKKYSKEKHFEISKIPISTKIA